MRSEGCFSVTGDILSVRYYADRLSTHFNREIQSNYFENGLLLSIEGYNIEFVDKNYKQQSEFYSHLSDDSQKYTSITPAHIIYILKKLEKGNKLNRYWTTWESTDDYYK